MSSKTHIQNVFHDAETGMFEAYVTIKDVGVTTSHIVHVPGPISLGYEMLRPALIRAAETKRKSGQFDFRQTEHASVAERVYASLFSAANPLDDILARAA